MSEVAFDLTIGDVHIPNPLVLASMAGLTNGSFAISRSVGLAILGGYNLDAATIEASKELVRQGRGEFAYDEPIPVIENELGVMHATNMKAGINARSATLEPLLAIADLIREKGAILELNAHCRQPEMLAVGTGQCLASDFNKLSEWIRELKQTDVPLSVKVRAGVVGDIELAKVIDRAGADVIHVDTMDSGPVLVKKIRNATALKIIANNSIVDYDSAHKMFSMGADFVSVARAAIGGNAAVERILTEIASYHEAVGWYNAPKHICAGGDLRGLAFCCMPVKDCPLHYVLKRAGITKEEYVRIKESFNDTKLREGANTCFGSMVWCCKITRPCPWRDSTLQTLGLSDVGYMRLKKRLAERFLSCRNLE
ncbi:MAG TPA: methanogenesis marker 9 domain-containing protein [Candidatus Bathyarchaeia archaeon]|nr:methanogenesis marker 9 domain-containing protein [Candidatus Bathyarchaeia archaeon]